MTFTSILLLKLRRRRRKIQVNINKMLRKNIVNMWLCCWVSYPMLDGNEPEHQWPVKPTQYKTIIVIVVMIIIMIILFNSTNNNIIIVIIIKIIILKSLLVINKYQFAVMPIIFFNKFSFLMNFYIVLSKDSI